MKPKSLNSGHSKNTAKRLIFWAGVVTAVLTIPLAANFPWTASDFVFAGSVLFSAGLGYELATMNMDNPHHRLLLGVGVTAIVMFIWALAVAD